jgi:methane monooxygenase PmoA-like
MRKLFAVILLGYLSSPSAFAGTSIKNESGQSAPGVHFKQKTDRIEVFVGGDAFTSYYFLGYNKPIFYPLLAASGTIVTRGYPMVRDIPGEAQDHPHHKGLWLTHGSVNGIDFWSEASNGGKIVHRRFERVADGEKTGILESHNDWVAPDGGKILEELREVRIHSLPGVRVMDFNIRLTAVQDSVKFGDTKEGTFGIRLAQPFSENQSGHIENSRGGVGEKECWGKQAEWVDFTAKIKGEIVGVAIFDHPSSFRYPTYWHVRGYTLFAVNPFGLHDFYNDPGRDGSYTLRKGEFLTLRYRVFIHPGTTREAGIAAQYKAYSERTQFDH